jgi:hypothetical protein
MKKMSDYTIGIDISKDLLDIFCLPCGACCVIDDLPDIYGRDGVLTRLIAVETADLV